MLDEAISRHERDLIVGETDNPFDTLLVLSSAHCLPRCLHVVADLGVADVLGHSPRTAREIAAEVGADPDALRRALRLLSAHGVFTVDDERVEHNAASVLLRDDHPQSMRALVQMFGFPIYWDVFGVLEHSIRTGQPAIGQVYPGGFWDYFSEHPEQSRIFNAAMSSKAHAQIAEVMASYDFSGFTTISDIGGGNGHMLRAIIDNVPTAVGVLFDLPHVIDAADGVTSERLTLYPGDFFQDELPASDLYILMEIIYDWGDDESIAILEAVRRAAPSGATLLLIERRIEDLPGPSFSKILDIHMLAGLGGRQRTLAEYEALLQHTGFRLQRDIPTKSDISIIEATAH